MSRTIAFARRALLVAALALPVATEGQVFEVRRRSEEPLVWSSLSVGLFQSSSVIDGSTESEWRLNDAAQLRASLEYALRGGSAVGVVATHARVPFTYLQREAVPDADPDCTPRCDATMTVNSVFGTFHGGGGQGLHSVFDVGLGYTWYRDFEKDAAEGRIANTGTDQDFSFFFDVGFGYGLSRRLSINVAQGWTFVRHQGEGLSNDERTTTQQRITRIGVRYGLGNRRFGL